MGNALITFKKYGWMIPIPLVIALGMFAANLVLIRQGFGLAAIACTNLVGTVFLWAVYSALALKMFSTPGLYFKHALKLLSPAGYLFSVVLLLDTSLRQETLLVLAAKLVIWAVSSVPLLILAARTFETRRIFQKLLSAKRGLAEISPVLSGTA